MKKSLFFATAAMALALPVQAATIDAGANANVSATTKSETKVEQKSDGAVQEKRVNESTSVDSAGTETKESLKAKAEQDAEGNASKTVETKSTVDPKGLMNEKTTQTKYDEKVEDGKKKIHRVKKVNGKTVVDENQESAPASPPSNP
jgi:hypothetical protein